jgi:choline dehydrogenase
MVRIKKPHFYLLFIAVTMQLPARVELQTASQRMISNLTAKTAAALKDWATHIVVGAGAAGSIVAARLAENPENKVLVIELGPNNSGNPIIATPGDYSFLWDNPLGLQPSPTSLAFETITQDGRTYRYPRGNGFGGSVNHHSVIDGRGSPKIYDNIAALVGDSQWSYNQLLPYFKKMENYHQPVDKEYHGTQGWLQVQQHKGKSPLHADMIQAAHQATKAPIQKDLSGNPKNNNGISYVDIQVDQEGKRSASYENLLNPYLKDKKNIIILFNTLATKIIIDQKDGAMRASGVQVMHKPHAYQIDNSATDVQSNAYKAPLKALFNAKKEIILSGGAINTPQLLLLSGIGPKDHLEKVGVPVILDLPGVGSDLMDHNEIAITYEINPEKMIWPSQATLIVDNIDKALAKTSNAQKKKELQALRDKYAKYADKQEQKVSPGTVIIDWYSGMPTDIEHDLHIAASERFWFDFDFKDKIKLPDGKSRGDYFKSEIDITNSNFPRVFGHFLLEVLKVSHNAGSIRLASSNPTTQAILDLALYKDDEAVERMARGILQVREIVKHPLLKQYYLLDEAGNPKEIFPGAQVKTIEQLKDYIKRWSAFGHHISGTAKMGKADNPNAVVDTKLRVTGIPNLRVIDTSVYPYPYLHGYNTARAAYVVGEVGADLLKK